jgi:hypothetical protein
MPHIDAVLMLKSAHSNYVLLLLPPKLAPKCRPRWLDRSRQIHSDQCRYATLQSTIVHFARFISSQRWRDVCSLPLRKRR